MANGGGGFITVLLVAALAAGGLFLVGGLDFGFLSGAESDPFVDDDGNPIGTQVYLTGNVNIPDAVDTWIAWEAVNFDHNGMADLGVDPYNLTVPLTQDYLVTAQVRWEANDGVNRITDIIVNGAPAQVYRETCAAPATIFFCTASTTLTLTADDDISVRVRNDSGVALDVLSGATSSRFTVVPA